MSHALCFQNSSIARSSVSIHQNAMTSKITSTTESMHYLFHLITLLVASFFWNPICNNWYSRTIRIVKICNSGILEMSQIVKSFHIQRQATSLLARTPHQNAGLGLRDVHLKPSLRKTPHQNALLGLKDDEWKALDDWTMWIKHPFHFYSIFRMPVVTGDWRENLSLIIEWTQWLTPYWHLSLCKKS